LGDGQGGFSGTTNVAVGSNPRSVAIGDFNGDGKQDIATVNFGSNSVYIRLGDGQGGFSGTTNVAVGSNPRSVAIGDFNGDGNQDIAVANSSSNTVSIRLGDGQGGFSGTSNVAVGSQPYSVVVGDFNGDGNQDIATANFNSSSVSIRLGDGQGGFSGTTEIAVGSVPRSVAVGDFNGDGKQDIATANFSSNSVSIRLGDGLGGFSGTTEIVVGTSPQWVAIGDFNGDGKQDIATANFNANSNSVSIRLGDGQGGFIGTTNVAVGSNPQSLAVGDFDGDGKQDIAVANYNSSSVSIRLGVGDAAEINLTGNGVTIPNGNTGISTADHTDFGNGINTNRTYTIQNSGTGPLTINSIGISGVDMALFTLGDITLPATIAAADDATFTVTLTAGTSGVKSATLTISSDDCDEGSYVFNVQATIPSLGNYSNPSIATAGSNATVSPDAAPTGGASITAYTTTDFKGLLTVDQSTGVVTITNAHPAGTYQVTVDAGFGITQTFMLTVGNTLCSQGQFYAPLAPEVAVGTNPRSVAVGDFNGDGNQDIATANSISNSVSIRFGDGQGGFSGSVEIAVGSNPRSVAIGDFNGDGNQDIAAANGGSNSVSIRMGDGQGGFSGVTEITVGSSPQSVAVGDFNGDGNQDIATANGGSNSVSIRLGDGQGGFSGTTEIAVGSSPQSVAVGDFNGDGHQDIATANFNSSSVSIRLGDGLGGFSGVTEITVGSSPQSVAVGDFNGDGKQDIAVTNENSSSVSIRLGDGLGGFSGTANVAVGLRPVSLAIGDFNGDGHQDIATANFNSSSVSIRMGDGQGGFSGTTEIAVGSGLRSVAVGDFNGDGNQDIATANLDSNSVSIRLGIGDAAEINLTGNGVTIPNGNTGIATADHTDFGNGLNTNRTYTIQNSGTGPLPINSIGISGTDMALFTISGITLPTIIATGSEVNFSVNFFPISLGTKTATVTINNDNCDEGAYTFNVQATASIAPTLGNYSDPSIATAGGNAMVSPDAAPTGGVSVTAYTTTDFRGLLTVDQSTGVVTITNAHPAGIYAVTVDAGFGITNTFALTVGNTLCSKGQFYALAIPEVAIGTNPYSVAVGDFNGDGHQDIATANIGFNSNFVYIRLGDGQGGFSGSTEIVVGSSPRSVAVGDFNGDGNQDIAAANSGSNSVSIRLGDGQGGFSGTTDVAVGSQPYSVAVGDFNGDGHQDIATANRLSNSVSIRLGDGQDGFSGVTEITVGSSPRSLAVGDFNGDGHQDIAAANFGSSTVSIRLGDGQGGFIGTTEIFVGSQPYSVAVGDFNGDGHQDIATANIGSNSVSIRLGDGLGGFSGTTNVAVGSSPISVVVGDFNGDGNQDIAAANYNSGSVSIRLGDGQGGFSGTSEIVVGSNPQSLAVGDFNGDGKQDIAAANYNSSSVSIRLGVEDAAELNITGNGVTIPNGNTGIATADYTDFGNGLNTNRTYTIQNAGTAPLTINSIGISGADMALFTISGITLPTIIAAESEVNFSVNFFSTSLGTKTATVTINNDKCDEGSYAFNVQAESIAPTLGNYSGPSIATAGGNATISPDAAPTGGVSVTINTTTDFKGLLTVDQSTGVVSITNAHPAGSYEVTVDAGFGITQTFTLTVGNTLCSQGQFYAPAIPEVAVGTNPYSVAVGDFNGDGKQDIATVNEGSNSVSIRLGDGQGGFSGTTNVAVGSNPQSVAIGDFNGDGNQDIAVANRISNTVSIRLGDGQGGFSGTKEIAVGLRPYSVAVGDFNGDGKQDIATANYGSDRISIRLGDGQGGFSGTTDFNVGLRPLSLAIGDFNGDGKQDIATVLSSSSNIVSIHLGDGQGGFSSTTNVAVGSSPFSVAIGDFNGDGKQDIAVANSNSNSVSIRLGDGLGGFSGTTNVAVGSSPFSVAIGDFNGDGKQDIAATNRGSNSVSIRLGDGQGGFSGTTNVTVGEGLYSSVGYSVAVGDFNGDGNQDIAAVNAGSNTVAIRLGIGDAAEINLTGNGVTIPNGNTGITTADHTDFGNGYDINRTYTIQNAGTGPLPINSIGISGADMALFTISGITLPITIAAGSEVNFNVNFISTSVGTKTATVTINNDDCDEGAYTFNVEATSIAIILGNYSDPSIAIAGGNATVSPDAAPTGGASITAYTTTDFKGLLTVDRSTGAVTIANAHPAGTFQVTVDIGFGITKTFTLTVGNTLCSQGQFYVPAIPEVAVESNPFSVTVGDFNGDGWQDIATAHSVSNTVSIRLGDGQGGFSGTTNVAVGSNPQSVAVGDFNGDGKQDIATANRGSSTISIRLGDGQGGFSGTTEVRVGFRTRPVSVAVGDFNGDGKQDIAAANQASSTVSILLGDGQGGFSGTTDVAVGSTPRSVAIGDFNGDGKQDIATANFNSNSVSIRLGDGQGGFSGTTNVAVGLNPQSVAVGDFNGDGKQDIATANFNSNSVSIRLGDGQGGFSGTTEIIVDSNPQSLAIGDFNGDGNQDIATANEGSNSVSIRLGDGQGGFSDTTEITVGIAPRSVAVGDFNGDGNQDIAAANSNTAGSVSILLGGDAEINLQGNGIAITSGDNTPDVADDTDFGTVVLNTPSTKTYAVQNTGTSDLIVSAIDISGTDSASFAIGDITLPATIAAGDVATFTVTLTAGTSGVKSATVTISNDDCDESAYTFSVQGKDDSYTVSFDANGGTGTMSGQAIANNASADLTSNTITRTGYTFAGWATTSGGAVAYADGASYTMSEEADVTLYAQWTPNSYAVAFNGNSGTGNIPNQFIAYLASANLAANAFTRTGYSFTGWNTAADGSGISYADGASYTMNDAADVTLFAAWTVNNYTVTFDSNGGSGTMTNQSIAFNAAANLTVNSFTRTGYSFTGWNTAADGSGISYADGASYTMSTAAGVTLFATWTANNYTVTFDANGSFGEMSDQTIAYDASENLTANAFNLPGYTFAGWATTPTGAVAFADGAIYTMSTTANVTLYARWISTGGGLFIQIFIRQSESMPRYVGGIGTTFTLDVGTSDAIESVKNQISNRITSVPGENLGLRFAGIILEDGRTLADYNIGNESVINLFAVNLYPATSVEVGGTASVLSVAAPGADYTNKTVSTTSDFTGILSILPSGEVSIENASPAGTYVIQIDNNLVIDNSNFSTPFQEFNLTVNNSSYTVIFNANGGTGTMADQSIDLNASANLTANTFTRTGYTFIGWATTSAGAVVYANGANYTMSDAADVTLYAQWIEVPTISAGGPLTFCAGENVVLTSSSATGNQWYKGGVLIADAINETYTASETGIYTVKVTTDNVESTASAGTGVTVTALVTYYADSDGDGFGNPAVLVLACSKPAGYVSNNTDCDDTNPNINPGATEICGNSIDDNCNGQTDEGCVVVPITAPIGQISGAPFVACTGVDGQVYSIPTVPNASTYTWVVTGGIQIASGQGTTQITVNLPVGFTTGTIRVRASNSVSQTTERVLSIRSTPAGVPGATSGTTTGICAGSSRAYSIAPVGNTGSYEWLLQGSGVSISNGQGSTEVTLSFATGFTTAILQVRAVNSCGTSGWRSLTISSGVDALGTPGAISGTTQGCPLTTQTYSIPAIAGATDYIWRTTGGIVISNGQGTNSAEMSFPVGFLSGSIFVKAANACGQTREVRINVTGLTKAPGAISGQSAAVCGNTTGGYSIAPVAGATSYVWTTTGDITLNLNNGTSASFDFGTNFTTGTIRVQAVNGCGPSAVRTLTVRSSLPARPGVISGLAAGLCQNAQTTYSIQPVSNATSYTWSTTGELSVFDGQGSTSATIEAGASFLSGQVLVVANGACGSSTARTFSVRSTPLLPGVINGQKPNVDRGAEGLPYSINPVVSATSYFWEGTNGISIETGQGTNTITVDIPEALTKGVLRVAASNACGQGPFRSLSLTGVEVLPFAGGRTVISQATMEIYPNPTEGLVMIQLAGVEENSQVWLSVFDLSGKQLTILDWSQYINTNHTLDLSAYPAGMYLVQVFGDDWTEVGKLVKTQ
jgi:uncharacterized repeat protein (TIGR02543 family)